MKSDAAFYLGKLTSRWVEFQGVSRLGFLLSQTGGFAELFFSLNVHNVQGLEQLITLAVPFGTSIEPILKALL